MLGFLITMLLLGCGGGGGSGSGSAADLAPVGSVQSGNPMTPAAAPPATPPPASVVVPAPVLSFSDTGVSLSDGITSNGRWSVTSPLDGLGWEYSLDLGRSWTRGQGASFDVVGDGRKSIWVRTFDQFGNRSEIVMTACTLDTMPPAPPRIEVGQTGGLPVIRIDGLEPMAVWEYSLDEGATWNPGRDTTLAFAGNALRRVWWRQRDAAGNPSTPVLTPIDDAGSAGWIEASGAALAPSALPAWQGNLVLHGEIFRTDTDFIRFDVPVGQRLRGLRPVHYASADAVAFYALQRGPVFDAGTDVQRMLSWKHLGPQDLQTNLISALASQSLGDGPHVLWVNQTGVDRTVYAIEIEIGPR